MTTIHLNHPRRSALESALLESVGVIPDEVAAVLDAIDADHRRSRVDAVFARTDASLNRRRVEAYLAIVDDVSAYLLGERTDLATQALGDRVRFIVEQAQRDIGGAP